MKNRTSSHSAFATIITAALLGGIAFAASEAIPGFTATTENVNNAHDSIRIVLLRWSTDAERDQLISAWNLTGAPARSGQGARSGSSAGNTDPFGSFGGNAANPPAGGRAGRGGRGGRGEAAPPRRTPETSLAAALGKAPTVGYLWSSEVAGYALRYAIRLPAEGGGERVILMTDRRLGDSNDLWKPVDAAGAANYGFSLIELRLNAKHEGEGKISLTGKVAVDNTAKTLALENYAALPVILRNVRLSK